MNDVFHLETREDAPRVLVVDDEAHAREVVGLALEVAGFDVRLAVDGREGLERALQDHHDVVLTDIHMPRMDGDELAREIGLRLGALAPPVIGFTADRDLVETLRGAGGFRAVIRKPVSPSDLVERALLPSRRTAERGPVKGPETRLPTGLTRALEALIEAGGPDEADGEVVGPVVLAAREAAEQSRHAPADPADGPGLRPSDPADRIAGALVRWGDAQVDARVGPWESGDEVPDGGDPDALVRGVVAVKRSVRLAVFSVDAHIRDVHRRRAAERGRILGDFGRTLAHEIKNRLGAAETALLMLDQMDDAGEETRDRIYRLVGNSLDSAQGSVDDVRGLALYRDPSRFPTTRPESLGEIARRAAESVRYAAEDGDVRIDLEHLPAVRVDGGPARLILTNLIENGVKYADPDGADRWVRVTGTVDGSTVRLIVEDNGVGIPEAFHERVFHRSVRMSDDDRGSGLGLAIVRDAVRELGGTIALASEPGRGTCITVDLPLRGKRVLNAPVRGMRLAHRRDVHPIVPPLRRSVRMRPTVFVDTGLDPVIPGVFAEVRSRR